MARTRGTTPPVDVINNMGNRPIFQHLSPPLPPLRPTTPPTIYCKTPPIICSKTQYVVFTATTGCHLWHPPFILNLQVDLEAIFASLYMPFTSPPNSPPKARAAHHRDDMWRKIGRAPDCPCARKSTPRQSGARPQIPINLQVSDVLTMRQRVRRQIDLGQLRTIDMRVDLRGRYIGMSQDLL